VRKLSQDWEIERTVSATFLANLSIQASA